MIELLALLLLEFSELGISLAVQIYATKEEVEVHRDIYSHKGVEDRANVFSELLIFNPIPNLAVPMFVLDPANGRVKEC